MPQKFEDRFKILVSRLTRSRKTDPRRRTGLAEQRRYRARLRMTAPELHPSGLCGSVV
jgi:hypothetical protein